MSRKVKYIVVVCEGYTEVAYLNEIKKRERMYRVEVKPICIDGEQKPAAFVEKAYAKYCEIVETFRDLNRLQGKVFPDDELWCVYDVDDKTNGDIISFESLAQARNIKTARSHPSFELWFYLHFADITLSEQYDQACMCDKLKEKWQKYHKARQNELTNMDYLSALNSKESQAIIRAQNLREAHNRLAAEPTAGPRTYVDELVSKLKA